MCSGQCIVADPGQCQTHYIIEHLSCALPNHQVCILNPQPHDRACLSIRPYRPRQAAQRDSTHTHKSTMTHTLDLWPWPVLVQLTDIRQIYGASHEADWGHMECMWVHKYVDMPYASHREAEDRVSREGRSTLVMSRREQQQMNNMPFSSSTHCIISLTYIKSTELCPQCQSTHCNKSSE